MTWLGLANAGFTAAGVTLYLLARKRLLRRPAARARGLELGGCLLVCALAIVGFALAHAGMNLTLSGRASMTDVHWLEYALGFSTALVGAHLLLRRIAARADELVLPLAAFLALLGLVNVYTWETRDANAYVSTVALPALRHERALIAGSSTLAAGEKARLLRTLGPVPNELRYERRTGARATILDGRWLDEYNSAVGRFRDAGVRPSAARIVTPGRLTLRQLSAAALGLLIVPLVLLAARRAPLAFRRVRLPLLACAAVPLALLTAAIASTGTNRLSPLLRLGEYRVTVFEFVQIGLVTLLALALAARGVAGHRRDVWAAGVAAVAIVGLMVWRDTGAGVTLIAVAAAMTIIVSSRVTRALIVTAGIVVVALAPTASEVVGPALPQTARVRLEMWGNPWGSYEQATLQNDVSRALTRFAASRIDGEAAGGTRRLHGRDVPDDEMSHAANRIEQELRWRLGARLHGNSGGSPLIPGDDPSEERLLFEAEMLWAELGGFRATAATPDFEGRVEDAVARLRATADRLVADGVDPGATRAAVAAADDFQLQRSLYALRAGGILGVGLGQGRPEAIPGLTEDLPIVGLGESSGLLGVVLVMLLVLLLAGRGLELAGRQSKSPAGLLAAGLATLLALQALTRVGGLTSLVPFTGLTFPFLSRGGTGLLANFVVVALLLAVSERPSRAAVARQGRWRRLRMASLPTAFAVVVGNIALLQLAGRTLAPGPPLAGLPTESSVRLHASNQWDQPDYARVPGPILARNGRTLAETIAPGAARRYPEREVASSLGHTLLRLDLSFRERLLGRDRNSRVGPSLVTTIDPGVQRAVDAAFRHGTLEAGLADVDRLRGAVAVVDVRDGGIVALLSKPGFSLEETSDPLAWARAEAAERRTGFAYRYLNRAVQGYYPPGSIFKTLTAAGVLERGFHTLHSRDFDYDEGPEGRRRADRIDELGPWHQLALPDGPPITDGNHPQLDSWVFDLASAFTWSCNVAFAQMGLELGPADLVGFARRFGFERPLAIQGLGTSISTLDNDWRKQVGERYLARSASNLARTAFGQGQSRVTPLQMALVPAAIANGGTIMQPHVVAGWMRADGTWLERYRPRVLTDTGLSARTIADLRAMMRLSVTKGWARTARLNPNNARPGVAGKTGSAEWSEIRDASHAWFIGFFPTEAPRLAIAVVVERGGSGPTVAGRIARSVFASEAVQRYANVGRP